jgi:hypothetical protein
VWTPLPKKKKIEKENENVAACHSTTELCPLKLQSTETGCMFSASFLSSSNRTDDKYRSPKLGCTV